MADDFKMSFTPTEFALAMTNRVARERQRIARMIDEEADRFLGIGEAGLSGAFRELAEEIRSGEGTGIRVAPVVATTEDRDEIDEAVQPVVDEAEAEAEALPVDRQRSDEDDAAGLLRARTAFGRTVTHLRDD